MNWASGLLPAQNSCSGRRNGSIMGGTEEAAMSLGWKEMSLIGVALLVFFGPAKLPELGKAFGKTLREFRNASKEPSEEHKEEETAEKK